MTSHLSKPTVGNLTDEAGFGLYSVVREENSDSADHLYSVVNKKSVGANKQKLNSDTNEFEFIQTSSEQSRNTASVSDIYAIVDKSKKAKNQSSSIGSSAKSPETSGENDALYSTWNNFGTESGSSENKCKVKYTRCNGIFWPLTKLHCLALLSAVLFIIVIALIAGILGLYFEISRRSCTRNTFCMEEINEKKQNNNTSFIEQNMKKCSNTGLPCNSIYKGLNIPLNITSCLFLVNTSELRQIPQNFSICSFQYIQDYNQYLREIDAEYNEVLSTLTDKFTPKSIKSCIDIYELDPFSPSGYYWVRSSNGSAVQVYCDLGVVCDNRTGGWMRVAELNVSESKSCPSPWGLNSTFMGCGSFSYSCNESTVISTHGVSYSNICGRVYGSSSGSVDGFDSMNVKDRFGFDGVGITLEQSDNLIWSFVAGHGSGKQSCPCVSTRPTSTPTVPPEIVNHYFCSQTEDGELWNGGNFCNSDSCCNSNSPWFFIDMPQDTADNMNVTICIDSGPCDEAVHIQFMELYVQ